MKDRIIIMLDISRITTRDPAWMAVVVSIIISIWIIVTDDLINSDGVLYVEVASKILNGDWVASVKQFNWPFYSLLIASVSKISFLDLETSAHIVNILTQALLTFIFVRCVQLLGGNSRVAWFAAILILTNVTLSAYRDQIIRDFGYWAFFFTALYFFLQYYQSKLIKYAIGFSISMIIATLFRIEGIVFLFFAPLLILFQDKELKSNLYKTIQMLSPVIMIGVVALIYSVFSETELTYIGRISDPISYLQNAYQNLISGVFEKGQLIEKTILVRGAKGMGTESILMILFMMLVAKVISASGYIALYFSISSNLSSSIRNTIKSINIIYGFMFINVLVLIVFLLSNGFLSSRYTMTMGLLISLPAAFGLSHFMENKIGSSVWKKRIRVFIIVILSYMFLDGITSFGASKVYIKESGIWLRENIEKDARVIANDRSLYYYANKNVDRDAINKIVLGDILFKSTLEISKDYEYLVIEIDYKKVDFENKLIDWIGSRPIHRTYNKRGDVVAIFKLK